MLQSGMVIHLWDTLLCEKKNCEALLSNVGIMANSQSLEEKSSRLDVTKLMIFTDNIGPINRIINVCVDGDWIKILLVEDVVVSLQKDDGIKSENDYSSEESDSGGDTPELVSGGEEESEKEGDVTGLKEGK